MMQNDTWRACCLLVGTTAAISKKAYPAGVATFEVHVLKT